MGFSRTLGRQRAVQSTINVKITVCVRVCVCVCGGGGGEGGLGVVKNAQSIMEDTVLCDRENKSRLAVHLLNQ